MSMICARCAQPIEKGQLYQEARRFKYTESERMQSGHVDPGVWVHDSRGRTHRTQEGI
jgi:hypothetical protein